MNLKSQKGAITLFVLVSCLFFLTAVACVSIYTYNKQSSVNKEFQTIKSFYEKDLDNLEDIYDNLKDIKVSFGKYTKDYTARTLTVPVTLNTTELGDITIKYCWIYSLTDLRETYPNTSQLNQFLTDNIPENETWNYIENEHSIFAIKTTTSCQQEGYYFLCFMLNDTPFWSNCIKSFDVKFQVGNDIQIITPNSNLEDLYGKEIRNYNGGPNGTKWRVFYIDFDGDFGDLGTIYLKADYDDSTSITLSSYSSYQPKDTSICEKMNPDWWEARGTSQSSWNINEHSVAYLCDPTTSSVSSNQAWVNFFDSSKANYAIGSPSIEMYCKSYNQVSHDTGNNSFKAVYLSSPSFGYELSMNNSLEYTPYPGSDTLDYSTKYGNMYCGIDGSKTGNWWLSSPSATALESVCYIRSTRASFNDGNLEDSYAICPVVALKTSFVPQLSTSVTAAEVEYNPNDNSWNPGSVQNAITMLFNLLN